MSGTIPASAIVQINPGVLSAGGSSIIMQAVVLTQSLAVPLGTVKSFANPTDVASFFGSGSSEADIGEIYFDGFTNCEVLPQSILFAQYNPTAAAAYLRSALVTQSLAQLQALSGTLIVAIDGYTRTAGTLDFSSANSFSAIATAISTGLNASPATVAAVTASLASSQATFTASIAGNVLTTTGAVTGTIVAGATISGTGVTGCQITGQLSGVAGGAGTYAINTAQNVASSSITAAYGTLTVSSVTSGSLAIGQTLAGTNIPANTQITQLGTGTGGAGTYFTNNGAIVASEAITATPTPVTVTYDSQLEAFTIKSGVVGVASTAAFATGTLSANLSLTSATGAVLSQGAAPATPDAFMTALAALTQNWATFMTSFDPDNGSGNTQKLAFATWNGRQNNRYAYICWDTDVSPTVSNDASQSLGQLIKAAAISGTCLIWGVDYRKAAFVCGVTASINWTGTNRRITYAFKSQSGLTADVTNQTVAENLIANGYNFYGVYATANDSFIWFYNGSVSGQFKWLDAFVNQIWLNNALQLAMMVLLQNVPSLPYNPSGYDLVRAAGQDPINAALNFGAIRSNVPLSAAQIAEINNAAGAQVANIVQTVGYYLQIKAAQAIVRSARTSPPITLWYNDGGAIQQINIASIEVQ